MQFRPLTTSSVNLWFTTASLLSFVSVGRGMATTTTTMAKGGVIIFCHGSGDTGRGAKAYVEGVAPVASLASLERAGLRLEYPSAVPRPYRLMGGDKMSIWFDRYDGMAPTNREDTASVEPSAAQLNALIDDLVTQHHVPADRIALGGFSMGGGIALQTAARCRHQLGAVFALSSYLCDDSWVWQELTQQCRDGAGKQVNTLSAGATPVFLAHGDRDDFVLPQWGKATATRLRDCGVDVRDFVTVPGARHEMTYEELETLFEFLLGEIYEWQGAKM